MASDLLVPILAKSMVMLGIPHWIKMCIDVLYEHASKEKMELKPRPVYLALIYPLCVRESQPDFWQIYHLVWP